MALVNKLTMEEMLKLKKMPRDEAFKFIKQFDLDAEETAMAEKIFFPLPVTKHYDNRLWVVVAHLLGASFRQIAREKGVSPQSVFSQVSRVIPDGRSAMRLAVSLSLEAMAEYKIAFFENVESLRDKPPEEIAVWLATNVDLDR